MKKGDFIDLITRYGSFFVEEKKKHHKIITEFINYVAAQNGVDYGIYMEELEKHKKRDIVPVDVDIMIRQSRMLEDCYTALLAIYRNAHNMPAIQSYVEYIADKQGGSLNERIKVNDIDNWYFTTK